MADLKFLPILMLLLCINIVLVYSGILNTNDEGVILKSFITTTDNNNIVGYNQNLTDNIKGITSQGTVSGSGFEGFTDLPSTIKTIFSFLISSLTAPFQLWLNPKLELPLIFQWLIGLPLSVLWIFSLIGYWRNGE